MNIRLKTTLLLFLITAAAVPHGALYAQETDAAGEGYTDSLLEKYIELEQLLLSKDADLTDARFSIRRLMAEAEEAGRTDLASRLQMLDFVVSTRLENSMAEDKPEPILQKILSKEELLRAEKAGRDAGDFATAAAVGTTIAAGLVFGASTALYENFYREYTETEYADQAAFYLFWWQIFRTTSIVSGWTTAASALLSGLFMTFL